MAIVDHRNSHRNVAWRPIPQPRQQTGSPGGCMLVRCSKIHKGEKNCTPHLPNVGTRGPSTLPNVGTRKHVIQLDVGTCRPNLPPHTNTKSGQVTSSVSTSRKLVKGPQGRSSGRSVSPCSMQWYSLSVIDVECISNLAKTLISAPPYVLLLCTTHSAGSCASQPRRGLSTALQLLYLPCLWHHGCLRRATVFPPQK